MRTFLLKRNSTITVLYCLYLHYVLSGANKTYIGCFETGVSIKVPDFINGIVCEGIKQRYLEVIEPEIVYV